MRIVVVEDEITARRGLVRLLEDFDERLQVVGQAADGHQGLALLHALSPDVCFVDIRMPVMDGLEMIREARGQGLGLPFVVVSAYAEFEYARTAMKLDVHEYLVKPITMEDIETVISHLMLTQKEDGERVAHHPMVHRALKIIHEQYKEHINLACMGGMLKITPEYLSYLFHRDMGMNFSTYLRNYRIDKACELMKNGSGRIYEIAYATGFSDAKYFCRVFREVTGQSPGAYLKVQKESPDPQDPSS